MIQTKTFLPKKGAYKTLLAYQKAECVYDVTYHFAHRFLDKSDRTIDQMVQAARSGKQNIAEGSSAGVTSTETEIKLTNVAKASLQELLTDYEDFLRVRGLELWSENDERYIRARDVCGKHNDSAYYRELLPTRSAETIANIAITLIHQTDYFAATTLGASASKFPRKRWCQGANVQRQTKNQREKIGELETRSSLSSLSSPISPSPPINNQAARSMRLSRLVS